MATIVLILILISLGFSLSVLVQTKSLADKFKKILSDIEAKNEVQRFQFEEIKSAATQESEDSLPDTPMRGTCSKCGKYVAKFEIKDGVVVCANCLNGNL